MTLAVLAVLAAAAVLTVPGLGKKLPAAIGIGLVVLAASVVHERKLRVGRRTMAAGAAVLVIVALAAGLPAGRRYLDDRYLYGGSFPETITPGYRLLRSAAPSRVAVTGFGETYLFYG